MMTLGGGLASRALLQAAVFVIVARGLGDAGFGAFNAVLALAAAWATLAGFGSHILVIRDLSRDPDRLAAGWGRALAAVLAGFAILFPAYLASVGWILEERVSWTLAVLLGLSELLFLPVAAAATAVYNAREQMGRASLLVLLPSALRLAAALLFVASGPEAGRQAVEIWAGLHAGATAATAGWCLAMVTREAGPPVLPSRATLLAYVRAGLPFGILGGAQRLSTDADKFLLARLAGLEAAGGYAAAYRFVELALLPVHAMLAAAAPAAFRAGADGPGAAWSALRPLLLPGILYGLVAAVLLQAAAGLLPLLLGPAFREAAGVVAWLCWLPLLALPRWLLQRALGAGDHQHQGMRIAAGGAVMNLLLNLALIPGWGWKGAAAATLATEAAVVAALWLTLRSRHLRLGSATAPDSP